MESLLTKTFFKFIYGLHGVAILLPWNSIISSSGFFINTKLNSTYLIHNNFKRNFLIYVGYSSEMPAIVFAGLNIILSYTRVSSRVLISRMMVAVGIEICSFCGILAMAIMNTSTWPDAYFVSTIVLLVLISSCSGIYQNSFLGYAANQRANYVSYVFCGFNICGVLFSLLNMLCKYIGHSSSSIFAKSYFCFVILVLITCFLTLIYLMQLPDNEDNERAMAIESNWAAHYCQLWATLKNNWRFALSIWATMFGTLSCFPALQSKIKPIYFSSYWFTDIFVFLLFNLGALVGSFTARWIKIPSKRFLLPSAFIRIVVGILYFSICNYRPDKIGKGLPILLYSDAAFVVGQAVFAITSGHFAALSMIYASRGPSSQNTALSGMVVGFFLVVGVFSGVLFAGVLREIL